MSRIFIVMAVAMVANLAVVFCSASALGQSHNYFIGNSLTNDLLQYPGIETLASSTSTNEVLQVSQHVRCGSSLTNTIAAIGDPTQAGVCVPTAGRNGLDLGTYPEAFAEDIDRLILQPYPGSTLQQEIDSAATLIDAFHSNPLNANDEVFIYSTWGLQADFLSTWNDHTAILDAEFVQSQDTYDVLMSELKNRGYDVGFIPAGQAFADVGTSLQTNSIGDLNSIADLYRDIIHADASGRYLASVTTYLSLTGASQDAISQGYSDSTGSEVGAELRAIAAQATFNATATAVPEPGSFSSLLLLSVLVTSKRRKRA